jgi:hypothetical protein
MMTQANCILLIGARLTRPHDVTAANAAVLRESHSTKVVEARSRRLRT